LAGASAVENALREDQFSKRHFVDIKFENLVIVGVSHGICALFLYDDFSDVFALKRPFEGKSVRWLDLEEARRMQ